MEHVIVWLMVALEIDELFKDQNNSRPRRRNCRADSAPVLAPCAPLDYMVWHTGAYPIG